MKDPKNHEHFKALMSIQEFTELKTGLSTELKNDGIKNIQPFIDSMKIKLAEIKENPKMNDTMKNQLNEMYNIINEIENSNDATIVNDLLKKVSILEARLTTEYTELVKKELLSSDKNN